MVEKLPGPWLLLLLLLLLQDEDDHPNHWPNLLQIIARSIYPSTKRKNRRMELSMENHTHQQPNPQPQQQQQQQAGRKNRRIVMRNSNNKPKLFMPNVDERPESDQAPCSRSMANSILAQVVVVPKMMMIMMKTTRMMTRIRMEKEIWAIDLL